MGNNIENINEEWRDIVGYEGLYQVSNLGRIKSLGNDKTKKEKILKPQLYKNGYYRIWLYKNGNKKRYLVHRLVALAFIPNSNNLPCVNHKDEDKSNNSVENLEWCSVSYNINFGNRNKLVGEINVIKLKNHKLLSKPVLQFDLEGNLIAEYPSIKEA